MDRKEAEAFFEEDEPLEEVLAAYRAGVPGTTSPAADSLPVTSSAHVTLGMIRFAAGGRAQAMSGSVTRVTKYRILGRA